MYHITVDFKSEFSNELSVTIQVRWGSVLMDLTALQSQSEPKTTPCSTEWWEIDQHGPSQTVLPFQKQLRVSLCW